MRRTVLIVVLLAAASTQAQFFSEVVEVRITNVDVIVTERDGKPVRGLTKDDFEIYEDGVKKEISNFLEIQEDSPTVTLVPAEDGALPPRRPRQVVVFIDDAVLHPLRRNVVLTHLRKFLNDSIRPGDEVMIATWASSLKLELEPTSDRAEIDATVGRLASRTTLSSEETSARDRYHRAIADVIRAYDQRIPPEKPPLSMGLYEARSVAMLMTHRARQRVEALKSIIASMRGAHGRKILVLLTESLATNPAEGTFRYLDEMRDFFAADGSLPMQDARQFEMPSIVTDITDSANASGIAIYPIDGSGKEGAFNVPDASTSVRIGSSGASAESSLGSTLSALAAHTGGVALVGSSNWQLAFDNISNDLSRYYSLGYRSSGEGQDRLKRVSVRMKNKQYRVRTRHSVIELSASSEMNEAVAAHLFRDVSRNDLSIRAAAGRRATTSGSQMAVIPVTISIPTEKLTLLPDGTDLTGAFSLFAAFLRMDGKVSKVSRQQQTFRFPAESLGRRKEITVKLDVTADARTDGISVGVMDEASRATGFAAVKVQ